MKLWCYTNGRGDSEIKDWYRTQPVKNQAKILRQINQLQEASRDAWNYLPFVKKQSGGQKLYELVFSLNVEYRIIGYFLETEEIFVMLHCFSKNTQKSQNQRGFKLAEQRKREIIGYEEEFTHEYDFEEDETPGTTIH